MPFSVTTRDSAMKELAHFWSRAGAKRKAVTLASAEIDRVLRDNPFQGIKHANFYHLTCGPLTAIYDVVPLDYRMDIIQFLCHGQYLDTSG
jgi:hypothetical protein